MFVNSMATTLNVGEYKIFLKKVIINSPTSIVTHLRQFVNTNYTRKRADCPLDQGANPVVPTVAGRRLFRVIANLNVIRNFEIFGVHLVNHLIDFPANL